MNSPANGSPRLARSNWAWPSHPSQLWRPDASQAPTSEGVSCCSSTSSLCGAGSLVRVPVAGTLRKASSDHTMRVDSRPWHPRSFVAGSLSTTSCGSTASAVQSPLAKVRSPRPDHHVSGAFNQRSSSAEDSPDFLKPPTAPSAADPWLQRLLEDAQAAVNTESPNVSNEERERADEMANACHALGQELARLTEFVKWAESAVANAGASARSGQPPPSGPEIANLSAPGCDRFLPEVDQVGPERYYIGDGLVAQLLADAEAAA